MKTIVSITTGIVLYAAKEFDLKPNETAIDAVCDLEYNSEVEAPFWNFEKLIFEIKTL